MRSSEIDAALTPPEPFSVLLFDCDGTLVDSVTAYERAWERAFAAQGRTMPPGWYRARTGLSPPRSPTPRHSMTPRRWTKRPCNPRRPAISWNWSSW